LTVSKGSGNYTSIQTAINNAYSGDTIFVWAGTYSESVVVDMNSTNVKLIGGGEGNYWSDWTEPDNNPPFGIVDYPYVINEGSSQDNYPFTTTSGWL